MREGKLLLPLERDTASDAPVKVELTFVGQDKFPRTRGTLALVSPKFDVPMKNAHWDLYPAAGLRLQPVRRLHGARGRGHLADGTRVLALRV